MGDEPIVNLYWPYNRAAITPQKKTETNAQKGEEKTLVNIYVHLVYGIA